MGSSAWKLVDEAPSAWKLVEKAPAPRDKNELPGYKEAEDWHKAQLEKPQASMLEKVGEAAVGLGKAAISPITAIPGAVSEAAQWAAGGFHAPAVENGRLGPPDYARQGNPAHEAAGMLAGSAMIPGEGPKSAPVAPKAGMGISEIVGGLKLINNLRRFAPGKLMHSALDVVADTIIGKLEELHAEPPKPSTPVETPPTPVAPRPEPVRPPLRKPEAPKGQIEAEIVGAEPEAVRNVSRETSAEPYQPSGSWREGLSPEVQAQIEKQMAEKGARKSGQPPSEEAAPLKEPQTPTVEPDATTLTAEQQLAEILTGSPEGGVIAPEPSPHPPSAAFEATYRAKRAQILADRFKDSGLTVEDLKNLKPDDLSPAQWEALLGKDPDTGVQYRTPSAKTIEQARVYLAQKTKPMEALSFNKQMADYGRRLSEISKSKDISALEAITREMEEYRNSGAAKTDIDAKLLNATITQSHGVLRAVTKPAEAPKLEAIPKRKPRTKKVGDLMKSQAESAPQVEAVAPEPVKASPAAKPGDWLDNLSHETREQVFEQMRKIDSEGMRARGESSDLSPRQGSIAVGGAHMDGIFRSEAIDGFLGAMRKGKSPIEAVAEGNARANEAIAKWNASRKDYQVHRALDSQQSRLWDYARRFRDLGANIGDLMKQTGKESAPEVSRGFTKEPEPKWIHEGRTMGKFDPMNTKDAASIGSDVADAVATDQWNHAREGAPTARTLFESRMKHKGSPRQEFTEAEWEHQYNSFLEAYKKNLAEYDQ